MGKGRSSKQIFKSKGKKKDPKNARETKPCLSSSPAPEDGPKKPFQDTTPFIDKKSASKQKIDLTDTEYSSTRSVPKGRTIHKPENNFKTADKNRETGEGYSTDDSINDNGIGDTSITAIDKHGQAKNNHCTKVQNGPTHQLQAESMIVNNNYSQQNSNQPQVEGRQETAQDGVDTSSNRDAGWSEWCSLTGRLFKDLFKRFAAPVSVALILLLVVIFLQLPFVKEVNFYHFLAAELVKAILIVSVISYKFVCKAT